MNFSQGKETSTMFIFIRKLNDGRGNTGFFERSFFSSGRKQYAFSESAYDALRSACAPMPRVSISSGQVQGAFLPVFVHYPRFSNNRLESYCHLVENPLDTNLSKCLLSQKKDSLHLDCIRQMIQITINDSTRPTVEWLFTEKKGSKGPLKHPMYSLLGKTTLRYRFNRRVR